MQNGAVIGGVRADDHLRTLTCRCEAWRSLFRFRFGLTLMNGVHRLLDGRYLFFRRQANQAGLGRKFDVDAEAVGVTPRLCNELRVGIWNRLQMDVTAKLVLFA